MKKLLSLTLALVFVAGTAFAQDNDATITQNGNDHKAQIDQAGLEQVATITQKAGNANRAFVEQGPDATQTSTVLQQGSSNLARTKLTRDPAESEQVQAGNRNTALINQASDPDSRGFYPNGHMFSQKQYGNDNVAQASGSGSSRIDQYQKGNRNGAVISGLGNGSNITQKQVGDDNQAAFTGVLYDWNVFRQTQYGDDNRSIVNGLKHQPGTSKNAEDGFTYQNGDKNLVRVAGNGLGGNVVEVTQINNRNDALVTFTTMDNMAVVGQYGNRNDAVINQ